MSTYARYVVRSTTVGPTPPPPFGEVYSVNYRPAGGQYIDFGNQSQLSYVYNAPFSISLWMKTTALAQNFTTVLGKVQAAPFRGYELQIKNATLDFALGSGPSTYIEVKSNSILSSGVWCHIAITYSGSGVASGMKLYVNSVLSTFNTIQDNVGTGDTTTVQPFAIGGRGDGTNSFTGNLDEIAVYNATLTSDNVADIYNTGTPGNLALITSYPNLQLWCRMGDGDTIDPGGFHDHSVNAFTGSANTMNWFTSDIVADVP